MTGADGIQARTPVLGVGVNPNPLTILEVDPSDILVDEELKALRSWTGKARHELSIPALAQMIYEDGHQVPCLVRPTEDGMVLVNGHRRKEAVELIRSEMDPEWTLKVVVEELTEDQALRAALAENIQREDFTAIERAKAMGLVRKRFGWNGAGGTAKVAEFLGVSQGTVTQAEKLLQAPADVQQAVEEGRMTPTAALDLMAGKKDKVGEVAARAAEIAEEKARRKAEKEQRNGEKKSGKASADVNVASQPASVPVHPNPSEQGTEGGVPETFRTDAGDPADDRSSESADRRGEQDHGQDRGESDKPTGKPKASPKVESQHVRQAQREVEGALEKPRSAKLSEMVSLFEQWTGPAYPKMMGSFAAAFVDRAHGKLKSGDKGLTAAWDDLADALSGRKPRKVRDETNPKAKKAFATPKPKPVKVAAKKKADKPAKKAAVKVKGKTKAKPPVKKAAVKKAATAKSKLVSIQMEVK